MYPNKSLVMLSQKPVTIRLIIQKTVSSMEGEMRYEIQTKWPFKAIYGRKPPQGYFDHTKNMPYLRRICFWSVSKVCWFGRSSPFTRRKLSQFPKWDRRGVHFSDSAKIWRDSGAGNDPVFQEDYCGRHLFHLTGRGIKGIRTEAFIRPPSFAKMYWFLR